MSYKVYEKTLDKQLDDFLETDNGKFAWKRAIELGSGSNCYKLVWNACCAPEWRHKGSSPDGLYNCFCKRVRSHFKTLEPETRNIFDFMEGIEDRLSALEQALAEVDLLTELKRD